MYNVLLLNLSELPAELLPSPQTNDVTHPQMPSRKPSARRPKSCPKPLDPTPAQHPPEHRRPWSSPPKPSRPSHTSTSPWPRRTLYNNPPEKIGPKKPKPRCKMEAKIHPVFNSRTGIMSPTHSSAEKCSHRRPLCGGDGVPSLVGYGGRRRWSGYGAVEVSWRTEDRCQMQSKTQKKKGEGLWQARHNPSQKEEFCDGLWRTRHKLWRIRHKLWQLFNLWRVVRHKFRIFRHKFSSINVRPSFGQKAL